MAEDDYDSLLETCLYLAHRIYGSGVAIFVDPLPGNSGFFQAEVRREPSLFLDEGAAPPSDQPVVARVAETELAALQRLLEALKAMRS